MNKNNLYFSFFKLLCLVSFITMYGFDCSNKNKDNVDFSQLENKYMVKVDRHSLMQYNNGELFLIHSYYPYKGKCDIYKDSIIYASEAILIDKGDTIRVLSICNCNELFLEYHENMANNYDGIAVQVKLLNSAYNNLNKKIMISKKSPFIKRSLKTVFGEIILSIE